MKKRTNAIVKEAFQTVAVMVAQITAEDPVPAAKSAGVLYDNLASGFTLHKLKNIFKPKP